MDKDRILANQPAPDVPNETAETLDPNATWSPQPSAVYDLQDQAAAEGAARTDTITQADQEMIEREDTTGGCAAPGNSPFVIADHEVQHTEGHTKTELDFGVGLRSGQGQSGFGEPPVILPTRGPAGQVSIIELPSPTRERQGT